MGDSAKPGKPFCECQPPLRSASDESVYSDMDPNPSRVTKPRRRLRLCRCPKTPVCSPRLADMAQPNRRTYQCLYHQHAWVMDPLRAARIRRKLEDINVMTLEELEDQVAQRAKLARTKARRERRKQKHTYEEFSGLKLEELFETVAKCLTKRMVRQPLLKPLIVSAATKRLLDYSADVVDNAMDEQLRVGGVKDLTFGCPEMEREERMMRGRVAQEMMVLAKQVFFDTQVKGQVPV